jgi:hypothetical protein
MRFDLNDSLFLSQQSHIQLRPHRALNTKRQRLIRSIRWKRTLRSAVIVEETTELIAAVKIIESKVRVNGRGHIWDTSQQEVGR